VGDRRLPENLGQDFANWHKYRYESSADVVAVPTFVKEIIVKRNLRSEYRRAGLVPSIIAVAMLVGTAGWVGQAAAAKKSPQDDEAARAARRAPPPSANRQTDQQSTSKTSGARRENSAGREISGSSRTRGNQQSGDAASTLKNATKSLNGKSATSDSPKFAESKIAARNTTRAASGNRLSDANKDKKDKGDKGAKDFDAKKTPVDRGHSPDMNKGSGSSGTKSPAGKQGPPSTTGKQSPPESTNKKTLPPPQGNKSSVDDVRKRLEPKKGTPSKSARNTPPNNSKRPPVNANMFQERMKAGDLNRLTTGQSAKSMKLADQYRMYSKGDVARRMELQKHGNHPPIHGVIGPAYKTHCMKYNYWGPSFFVGVCLYPHWSPWVDWSWHHHCRPYWDPRPIWCRPVVYESCPGWVYWETPAWTPLPEVACGTWVDLKPIELPPDDSDLQLVAVRFVDPGHPEEKLGPRYRVWFRNNGSQPIHQPFNVIALAGNDERIAADAPQSGARVTAIEPGDIQSVDIRLPPEVYAMGRDAQGNPAPFRTLQVLVDANQEIAETTKANNGTRLAPADILPVDPAAFELKPKTAKASEEILLAGEGFGPQPGRILVQVNGREMDGEILGWYDLGVQWTLPKLALTAPVEADVVVIRGDGAASNPIKITIAP
jgi:hypothetical protein